MRRLPIVLALVLVVVVVLMGFCAFDSLLMMEVWKDYASPRVLDEQAYIDPLTLPWWTRTPWEWHWLEINMWVKAALLWISAILLGVAWWQGRRPA